MVVTAVVALGQKGVWHLQHVDFNWFDKKVNKSFQSAHFSEEEGEYALIERRAGIFLKLAEFYDLQLHCVGGKVLLIASNANCKPLPFSELQFKTHSNTLTHDHSTNLTNTEYIIMHFSLFFLQHPSSIVNKM